MAEYGFRLTVEIDDDDASERVKDRIADELEMMIDRMNPGDLEFEHKGDKQSFEILDWSATSD